MKNVVTALLGAYQTEMTQMIRSPLLVILTIIQAVTFLLLVSLFGLTGSKAPTALINNDNGMYSHIFIRNLETAHNSFNLRSMSLTRAQQQLVQGKLVAIISIPQGFTQGISLGQTVPITVYVDNIDADLTDDIQRALPSAVVGFGNKLHFPGIRVHVTEHDLLTNDTGFIPYLIVSALALDAFVVAGILSATTVAREFETNTIKLLSLSPVHPIIPFIGRVLAADTIAFLAMLLSTAIVILGYHVIPLHPFEMIGGLFICVIIFGCVGTVIGVSIKKTLPIASLLFGLALPLYIDSGALEPERFDGNAIWTFAHFSPLYYAVGILEDAFHGFRVTPEPVGGDFIVLTLWTAMLMILMFFLLNRNSNKAIRP